MTRVLVVSGDPVGRRMAGPGVRAYEIARALGAAGHEVTLAAPSLDAVGPPMRAVAYDPRGEVLRREADAAEAVVVGGLVLAQQPFLAALGRPVVVDLYAPFVLENLPAARAPGAAAASRRRRHASDVAALRWQLENGDFFLCASETQRDYYLGLLTAVGRVNPVTYDADPTLRRLIDVVPFGLPAEAPVATRPVMRGVLPGIGPEDRIVLWGGGIWDWLDPLTLIGAVAKVASVRDDVRLVFMGTRSPSPDVPPMVVADEARALAARLGLIGRVVHFNERWVPYAERGAYLIEADIGGSFHHEHIETRFAYRTRLLDYIWAGLPMLVTRGDVLAEQVDAAGLGRVVPPGDVPAAAEALAALLDDPEGRSDCEARCAPLRERLQWGQVVRPLLRFLRAPERAPDRPLGASGAAALAPTPVSALPRRALEALREGGPWLLTEEVARYVRWRRRPR